MMTSRLVRTRVLACTLALAVLVPGGLEPELIAQARTHVELGVDRLAAGLPPVLRGKRVGLITNHTGHDRNRVATIDLLAGRTDLRLVALYAPEHGIRGTASGRIESETDSRTGLPIHSLYGETRKPTAAMLEGVEALVFDIQDVGVRQYTYLSTMALAMQAAAEKRIPFVVLDRPNPIGGTVVEGNIREAGIESFVALYPIASRHGMTAGELARLYNSEFRIGADLTVVPLVGWKRDLWLDATDLPWTGPSPNLPRFEGVIHYPGTVFFEGTNLSEGRGSQNPFEQTGAPWLRAREVVDTMNARRLPGVRFEAVEYAVLPTGRKFAGQTIPGVRYIVTDRATYRPVATTMRLIEVIRRLHPTDFQWRSYMDQLSGSTRIRSAIDGGILEDLLTEWERDARRFEAMRRPYLLY
jgi:uncharacterized protein YbbC (DUF1343 family)